MIHHDVRRRRFERLTAAHVTLRVKEGVPCLRTKRYIEELRRSFGEACERGDFRLVHYSIQGDHLHLIVEADHHRALAAGMKALGSRVARAVQRVFGWSGKAMRGRYHAQMLTSLRQVRNAIRYVLQNARKHAAARGRRWKAAKAAKVAKSGGPATARPTDRLPSPDPAPRIRQAASRSRIPPPAHPAGRLPDRGSPPARIHQGGGTSWPRPSRAEAARPDGPGMYPLAPRQGRPPPFPSKPGAARSPPAVAPTPAEKRAIASSSRTDPSQAPPARLQPPRPNQAPRIRLPAARPRATLAPQQPPAAARLGPRSGALAREDALAAPGCAGRGAAVSQGGEQAGSGSLAVCGVVC